jgi:hypothetical protein
MIVAHERERLEQQQLSQLEAANATADTSRGTGRLQVGEMVLITSAGEVGKLIKDDGSDQPFQVLVSGATRWRHSWHKEGDLMRFGDDTGRDLVQAITGRVPLDGTWMMKKNPNWLSMFWQNRFFILGDDQIESFKEENGMLCLRQSYNLVDINNFQFVAGKSENMRLERTCCISHVR